MRLCFFDVEEAVMCQYGVRYGTVTVWYGTVRPLRYSAKG